MSPTSVPSQRRKCTALTHSTKKVFTRPPKKLHKVGGLASSHHHFGGPWHGRTTAARRVQTHLLISSTKAAKGSSQAYILITRTPEMTSFMVRILSSVRTAVSALEQAGPLQREGVPPTPANQSADETQTSAWRRSVQTIFEPASGRRRRTFRRGTTARWRASAAVSRWLPAGGQSTGSAGTRSPERIRRDSG